MIIKYPRTFHLPFSRGMTSDDKVLKNIDHFIGKHVIISEKMDGENTSFTKSNIWARSLDSNHHESRSWVKNNIWSKICYDIPDNWRICGENLYAKHSIHYKNLKSYFYGFSIWNEKNETLSWIDTLNWFTLLDIQTPKIFFGGILEDSEYLVSLVESLDLEVTEGYIIRLADSFHYDNFNYSVAKYVREKHVQTSKHWSSEKIIKNELI